MKIIITEQQFNSLILNEGGNSLWWREVNKAVKLSDNIDDFENNFTDLFNHARKKGLVTYIKKLFYDKMTPEQIKQEIIDGDYKSRGDLQKNNQKLYRVAFRNNMLDELIPEKLHIDWTPELIRQEIKKGNYKSRKDLQVKNNKLYFAAFRNNMLDELIPEKRISYWTTEKIKQEFSKGNYKSREDLKNKNNKLYYAAFRNNMLDELIPGK